MNTTINNLPKSLSYTFHRFHILIFVIVVLGALTVAVYLLNQILVKSDQANGYTAQTSNTTFDTATIKRITELHTMDDPSTPIDLPVGRINPFVEQ